MVYLSVHVVFLSVLVLIVYLIVLEVFLSVHMVYQSNIHLPHDCVCAINNIPTNIHVSTVNKIHMVDLAD